MGYFSTKEYTDMSFAKLVEPDIALKAAKKQTAFAVNFNLAEYNKRYWTWKHHYRTRYSERKLERYGYEPSIYGESLEENIVGMTAYMQGIDPAYDHTISFKTGIADIYSQLMNHLQYNPGYDYNIKDRRLFTGGQEYVYASTTYLEDDDPYTPDDKSVIVGHFWNYNSLYPDAREEVFFDVELPNTFGTEDTFENIYTRDEAGTDYFIYLKFKNEVPADIYNLQEYEITPVIMLQEFGIPAENSDVHRQMLREFGVKQRDFEETLGATDDDGEINVDNAYMMNALSMLNPYEIESRVYQAYEAQHLSSAFLATLSQESLNGGAVEVPEGSEPITDNEGTIIGDTYFGVNDPDSVYPTQEEVDWWYNRHVKEQAYLARGLFKTFAYYANAIDLAVLDDEKFSLIYIGDSIADITSEHRTEPPVNSYDKIIKTGDAWVESDVDITVEQNRLKMRYGFDISIETKEGKVRPDVVDRRAQGNFHYSGRMHSLQDEEGDRSYWETDDSEGYDKLVIQVQKTSNTYQEMIITNYRADYDLGVHGFAVGAGAPSSMNRIILPYFILKEVKFREYVTISDHSFTVFMYSYEKVPFDWASFGLKVVLAILSCMYAGCAGIDYLWAIAKMVVYNMAISYLLELVDSEILIQILQLAIQVYQFLQGNFNVADMKAENYLMLASKVSNIANDAYAIMQANDAKLDEANRQGREKIDDKVGAVEESMQINPTAIMTAHQSFKDSNDSAAYYENMYGSALFSFEQYYNVDGELELRKQVVSG